MAELEQKQLPDYLGHRQRLRDKIFKKGGRALTEAELLEMILIVALPRRDVKPLTKQLLREFHSLRQVVYADPERLMQIKGVKESVISVLQLLRTSCERLLKPENRYGTILNETFQIVDFCRFELKIHDREVFYLLYLSKQKRLITMDMFSKEAVEDPSKLYLQNILRRVLNTQANEVIIVRMVPNGTATMTKYDNQICKEIVNMFSEIETQLYDYYVMTDNEIYSFMGSRIIFPMRSVAVVDSKTT